MAIVKVDNISNKVPEVSLRQFFSHVGNIQKFQWLTTGTIANNLPKSCLIQFETEAEANTALLLGDVQLGDSKVQVNFSDETTMPASSPSPSRHTPPPSSTTLHSTLPLPSPLPIPVRPPVLPIPTPSMPSMPSMPSPQTAFPGLLGRGLAAFPAQNLSAPVDPTKVEEIARTIYIGNISSAISEEELTRFFASIGPVAYCKLAGDISQPARFAFLEFVDVASAQAALQLNGTTLGDRPIKVNHSKNAIVKPVKKVGSNKQIDEAMRKVLEAREKIASKIHDDDKDKDDKKRSRSRSRSGSKSRKSSHRSRSRDRKSSRRDRSKSRDKKSSRRERSRDRKSSRRDRSRSRDRR